MLRQIATDMLHALAVVWSIQRSDEGAGERALTLRRMAAWHGDQRHHEGLVKGMLKGRTMGAYFGESLGASHTTSRAPRLAPSGSQYPWSMQTPALPY